VPRRGKPQKRGGFGPGAAYRRNELRVLTHDPDLGDNERKKVQVRLKKGGGTSYRRLRMGFPYSRRSSYRGGGRGWPGEERY